MKNMSALQLRASSSRLETPRPLYPGPPLIRGSRQWLEAELTVNENDPFFFDHPLDHVPGTMQLFGLLDIVRAATGAATEFERDSRLLLGVEFPAFCELGATTRLGCCAAPGGRSRAWQLRVEQSGAVVCCGRLELLRAEKRLGAPGSHSSEGSTAGDAGRAQLAPAQYVHRSDPANVVIGAPEDTADGLAQVPVIPPGEAHFLRRSGLNEHSPEELIEAARQFAVLTEETAAVRPGEKLTILRSVRADLPCGIPQVPLLLRLKKTERRGNCMAHEIRIVLPGGERDIGGFTISGQSVSHAAYSRMRKAAR